MTDNEIIKALECCGRVKDNNCENCPLTELQLSECTAKAATEALSLIKNQKAEIEKKDIEIDILIRKKEALNDEISDLKAEIEETQENSETLAIALIKAKAEVESLRNTVKTDFLTARERLKLSQSEIGEIRAEAIKEFASKLTPRLLKEMDEQGLMPSAYVKKVHAYTEIELFINEIVKEMTENQ